VLRKENRWLEPGSISSWYKNLSPILGILVQTTVAGRGRQHGAHGPVSRHGNLAGAGPGSGDAQATHLQPGASACRVPSSPGPGHREHLVPRKPPQPCPKASQSLFLSPCWGTLEDSCPHILPFQDQALLHICPSGEDDMEPVYCLEVVTRESQLC
jgi:hypothetical protein